MKYQRTFIIEIVENLISNKKMYVWLIFKNILGYFYLKTYNIEKAKQWKYKKNCEKIIDRLYLYVDPTKKSLKANKYQMVEITDKKILRYIKLKKIRK
jgi:hypothetical protein